MKGWSVIGLLFTAALLATIPVAPQVTQRGVELKADEAQAATAGRYRRVTRRAYRRAAPVAAVGYGAPAAGAVYGYGGPGYPYATAGYGPVGAGYAATGHRVEPAGPGRWCAVYPSGFRWCWTQVAYGPTAGLNPQPLPPVAPPPR